MNVEDFVEYDNTEDMSYIYYKGEYDKDISNIDNIKKFISERRYYKEYIVYHITSDGDLSCLTSDNKNLLFSLNDPRILGIKTQSFYYKGKEFVGKNLTKI